MVCCSIAADWMTVLGTLGLLGGAALAHWSLPRVMSLCFSHWSTDRVRIVRSTITKYTTVGMTIFYPAVSLRSLSLWNCKTIGSESYLVQDLSLACSGDAYRLASIFNACFAVVVIVGWPMFLVWYLRKISLAGRVKDERVMDRVGFLFQQYRYWHMV